MKPETVTVKNIFGVEYIELEAKDGVTLIGGKNGQGKTSLINAIMLAVKKKSVKAEKKVKEGNDEGEITITTDEGIIINHIFSASGESSLKITKDEKSIASPQKFLDEIIKDFTVDPVKFIELDPIKQTDIILEIAGIDVNAVNSEIKYIYDERTSVNRELKKAETIAKDFKKYAECKQVDVSALNAEYKEALNNNNEFNATTSEIKRLESLISDLKQKLSEAENKLTQAKDDIAFMDIIDTTEIETRLANANQTNMNYANYMKRLESEKQVQSLFSESESLSEKLKQKRNDKQQAINKVKIMEGLSLDDNDVLCVNGTPLNQLSTSEQLKISMRIAMLSQPDFKLIVIDRAESLDEDNMNLINNIATENGYRVFATKVGQAEIMIESGKIKK